MNEISRKNRSQYKYLNYIRIDCSLKGSGTKAGDHNAQGKRLAPPDSQRMTSDTEKKIEASINYPN